MVHSAHPARINRTWIHIHIDSVCISAWLSAGGVCIRPAGCPSVPPPPPCPSPGGMGDRHLVNTKFFCCGSLCCCVGECVARHCYLYPLYSWQDILLTFAEMELDSTTMFTPGTNVVFIHSTGETVLAHVVGYSEHGDAYRRISYERTATAFFRFAVQFLCLKMCVDGVGVVPQCGVGGRHLATVPRGLAGDRLHRSGAGRGGGTAIHSQILHSTQCQGDTV